MLGYPCDASSSLCHCYSQKPLDQGIPLHSHANDATCAPESFVLCYFKHIIYADTIGFPSIILATNWSSVKASLASGEVSSSAAKICDMWFNLMQIEEEADVLLLPGSPSSLPLLWSWRITSTEGEFCGVGHPKSRRLGTGFSPTHRTVQCKASDPGWLHCWVE